VADEGSRKVVGLEYDPEQGLPRVILKGGGKLAEEIIAAGKRMDGPPLVKDERLLEALYRLPIDGEIGPELFELVAALLVHVFAIDELAKDG
jgi:flagellar biosynthesis protein